MIENSCPSSCPSSKAHVVSYYYLEQRGHSQGGRAGEGWWREGVVRRREAGKARERSARKNAKRTARLGAAAARGGMRGRSSDGGSGASEGSE